MDISFAIVVLSIIIYRFKVIQPARRAARDLSGGFFMNHRETDAFQRSNRITVVSYFNFDILMTFLYFLRDDI
jgi:hypothetical protein